MDMNESEIWRIIEYPKKKIEAKLEKDPNRNDKRKSGSHINNLLDN